MNILLHPVYFGNLLHYISLIQANKICFEVCDNYQKQTYRNRCYIASANGKQLLNIPIKHTSVGIRGKRNKQHQVYKDVKIENDFDWQKNHWKTLQIAYRSSPFFEFYEDDLAPIFEKKISYLLDLNLMTFEVVSELLSLSIDYKKTQSYIEAPDTYEDFRHLVEFKNQKPISLNRYSQVFEEYHGFLPNLSILDLLFNEGPNAVKYLEEQEISLKMLQ